MLPAYIKIHDAIKKEIDKGTWKIGQRLPSERDLADDYSVSRMTLRQSITLLVEEGILERRVGSGTYVASHRVQEKMRGTTSFTEIVNSQGRKPSSKLISFQRKLANETEIQKLNLSQSEDSTDAAVINNDFVTEAGINPKSAIFIEPKSKNAKQWYNLLVAQKGWQDKSKAKAIKEVVKAYHTDAVKKVIEKTSQGLDQPVW